MESFQNQEATKAKWEEAPAYRFELLDPRPTSVAREVNERLFASVKAGVLGIEMTLPEFADKCNLGNIDPQHTDKDVTTAAIDVAVNFNLPPKEALMVTVRPDLDAFGSMAILSLRQKGVMLSPEIIDRVKTVSEADRFARGGWTGQKSLPTRENIWPNETQSLAVLGKMVNDTKISVGQRIALLERWLETGEEPNEYKEKALKERMEMIDALERGKIIAFIESKYRSATNIGYASAPIVIALNPSFSQVGSEPYKKYTICQFAPGYVDMLAVAEELNGLEKGWGGSPAIIGSPQGVSSILSAEQIIGIVKKYLIRAEAR